jgi:propionaldehyde dehydrogenase
MSVSEEQIKEIVKRVMLSIEAGSVPAEAPHGTLGVFDDINAAIKAAKDTQKQLKTMPMEFRENIIASIRKKTIENANALAELGVSETGMGRVDHKIMKHELIARKTPGTEDITTQAWSGDKGLTLIEMGPFGVIGAITPCTNPSETIICNSIGMIAGGNTVVFNAHPNAVKTSCLAVQLVNQASLEAGGPDNLAVTVSKPTLDTANALFTSPDITLMVVTGGPGVVTAALKSGKRAIGAGAGNPPVVVDETADIKKAAKDIVDGCTFDNNLPCIAEKEVIAVDSIADELMYYMTKNGSIKLSGDDVDKLTELVLEDKNGRKVISRNWVGRDAWKMLKAIGIEADSSIRCIIFEGSKDHPLITTELMMPILGIVRVKDVDEAIKVGVELEHGNRHSAHMHSKNIDNLTRFAREVDTAIFVKNAPSYAALGFGGEGYATFTIASRTGEGLTAAHTFTKRRRCVLADGLSVR